MRHRPVLAAGIAVGPAFFLQQDMSGLCLPEPANGQPMSSLLEAESKKGL